MSDPDRPNELPAPPATYYLAPVPPPSSGKAIASLVLGILGLITCQLLSPVAIVLGHQGKREAEAGQAGGRELAVAGIVLGWIGSALLILVVVAAVIAGVVFGLGGLVSSSFQGTASPVIVGTVAPEISPLP